MKKWAHIEIRLEYWGECLAKMYDTAYPSSGPIAEIIEYGVRTGGNQEITDSYDIDKRNQRTNTMLLSAREIDEKLYQLAHTEYVNETRPTINQIINAMGISRKTYYSLKNQLMIYIQGHIDS